jgi:hypothetical protein
MPSSRGSTYTTPRLVRLTFLQKEKGQTSTVIIYQKNGSSDIPASTTLYQWGRKDAFPGVPYDTGSGSDASNIGGSTIGKSVYGSFTKNTAGKKTYSYAIQHPDEFITYGSGNDDWHGDTDSPVTVNNAWAADNTGTSGDYATSSVVKTVYDPCPPGFKMPGSNAFSDFSKSNGAWTTLYAGVPKYVGYTFTKNSASVFFPAAGGRYGNNGLLYVVGSSGNYWSAVPYNAISGRRLLFSSGSVYPLYDQYYYRAYGFSVRPVQE